MVQYIWVLGYAIANLVLGAEAYQRWVGKVEVFNLQPLDKKINGKMQPWLLISF